MHIHTLTDVVKGQYPDPASFSDARLLFEELAIKPFIASGEVVSAAGFGSSVAGRANEASDQDYLVILGDPDHAEVLAAAKEAAKDAYNVPFDIVHFSLADARSGRHSVDGPFREQLSLAMRRGGYHGRNPLSLLAPRDASYRESLSDSAHLLSMIAHSGDELSEEERVRTLKQVMEKPVHAMRTAAQYELGTSLDVGTDVFPHFAGLDVAQGLAPLIAVHHDVAEDYVSFLKKRKDERMDKRRAESGYSALLGRMEGTAPLAYEFVDELARRMRH